MILTFDIGGANIKKLVFDNDVVSSEIHEFPFWKRRDEFEGFLRTLYEDSEKAGITMTAELCDCFESRQKGVEFIVSACEKTFSSPFYLSTEGRLLLRKDIGDWKEFAAANWVASAYFLEKEFGRGILLDVGGTTTDIVPFGCMVKVGKTDLERLRNGNLIYTGVFRTPVPVIVEEVPLGGEMVRVASEYFAITADVYKILEEVEYACETPDGAGKGRRDAMKRMARVLCSDVEELGEDAIMEICEHVRGRQIESIAKSLRKVSQDAGVEDVSVGGVGKGLGIKACEKAGLSPIDLAEVTKGYDNLPCLGLAYMLKDYRLGK